MKVKLLFITLSLILSTACSKEEKVIEEDIRPFLLSRQELSLSKDGPAGVIDILDGNGGYKIIYPKEIQIGNEKIPYPSALFRFNILNDKQITVERMLFDNSVYIDDYFLLIDKKGEKRLIRILTPDWTGNLGGPIAEMEEILFNTPDYWQM